MMATSTSQYSLQGLELARIETQLEAFEERIIELRKSVYGDDGSGGIIHRAAATENTLLTLQKEATELKLVAETFKKTLIKIVVIVVGSGALSGGVVAKVLALLAP